MQGIRLLGVGGKGSQHGFTRKTSENEKKHSVFDWHTIYYMDGSISEEELIEIPARLLNKRDRARRRRAMRKLREQKSSVRKAKEIARGREYGTCQGINKRGENCRANAVKGAKHCRAHLSDAEKSRLGVKTLMEEGLEARRVNPTAKGMTVPSLMKSAVEVAVERLIARYFAALGLDFVGFDEEGNPIVMDNGMEKGVRIYGESKDGDIVMTEYPDLMAQIQVMEKLMDRTYGKPKQTNIIEGGSKPIKVQPVRSAERSQEVASLLQRVGAVRPTASVPEPEVIELEASEPVSDNVVPLNRERDMVE